MISIIIAFDILYNNFDNTTTSLVEIENKIIDKIQNILQFIKAKNINKQVIRRMENIVLVLKKNNNVYKKKQAAIKCTSIAINLVILKEIVFNLIKNSNN